MMRLKTRGAEKVIKKNKNRMQALSAYGRMGRTVTSLGIRAHALMRSNVHKDTRALWAAISIDVKRISENDVVAHVHINRFGRNPRSGNPPYIYAKYENARGGSHAFFDKTARALKGTEAVAIRELTHIVVDGDGA